MGTGTPSQSYQSYQLYFQRILNVPRWSDFREKIGERLDQVLAALRRVLQGIKVLSLYSRLTVTEQGLIVFRRNIT